jgi:hypothetical protein
MTVWGMKASGGTYAALAALTNIPAMLFAALLYEIFLTDSSRGSSFVLRVCWYADYLLFCVVMPRAQMEFMIGHQKHQEEHGAPAHHILSGTSRNRASSTNSSAKEKGEQIDSRA